MTNRRAILYAVILGAVAVFCCFGRADAVETCPSRAHLVSVESDALYGFVLAARTPRTVLGTLALETDKGWYTATIPQQQLASRPYMIGVWSPLISVVFPQPVHLLNWWLEKARSLHDDAGWSAAGMFTCFPNRRPGPLYLQNVRSGKMGFRPQALPAASEAVHAVPVEPIETTSCAKPFVEAKVIKAAPPEYPFRGAMPNGTASIIVTISPTGQPIGTEVLKSAGLQAFDDFAQESAMRSTYSPEIAYCRPVYGEYLFKVTYEHG